MVPACSQVSVHDRGNANVENWGVVVRVRNSVVCVGCELLHSKGSKGEASK